MVVDFCEIIIEIEQFFLSIWSLTFRNVAVFIENIIWNKSFDSIGFDCVMKRIGIKLGCKT